MKPTRDVGRKDALDLNRLTCSRQKIQHIVSIKVSPNSRT